jgi:type II secretory pathway component PulJ
MGLTHGSITLPDVMMATTFQAMVALVIAMLRKVSLRSTVLQRFKRFAEMESIMDI